MRKAYAFFIFLLGVASSASFAATFSIDPYKSHISVSVPTWQREGDSLILISPDGEEIVQGYMWKKTYRYLPFEISGYLELSTDNTQLFGWQISIDSSRAVTSAPDRLGFSLHSALGWDPATGLLDERPCGGISTGQGTSWWSHCTQDAPEVTGLLLSNKLFLDGVYVSLLDSDFTFIGGLEPPSLPDFDYANASYTFHLEASELSVPEPDSVLLLLPGLLALLGYSRRTFANVQKPLGLDS